jgi:hypothetical protein
MINRRSFIKRVLGVVALPVVGITKVLKSEPKKKKPSYCVVMQYVPSLCQNQFHLVRYVGVRKLRKGELVCWTDSKFHSVDAIGNPSRCYRKCAIFKTMLPTDMEKPLFEGSDILFYRRRPVGLDRVITLTG